jgi:hypothetical protein
MRCDDERDHIKFCFDVTFADCRREYLLPLLGATKARQNDGNGRQAAIGSALTQESVQ